MKNSRNLIIYTDGGYNWNYKIGSWAYILIDDNEIIKQSGHCKNTTMNRMEFLAPILAIYDHVSSNDNVIIYSDSKYLVNSYMKWMHSWHNRGWTRRDGELKNLDLIKILYHFKLKNDIELKWVKGHSGNKYNEMADELCSKEAKHGIKLKKKGHPISAEFIPKIKKNRKSKFPIKPAKAYSSELQA